METLLLNESLINQVEEYINNQDYAIGTKRLYINNLINISKKYSELNHNNIIKLHNKFKQPFQRAIFKILNDFCSLNQIPFKINLPTKKTPSRKLPETLSRNELKIIIDSCPEEYKLLIRSIYGFGAGIRISEAISIAWHRFNWNEWLYKEDNDLNSKSKLKSSEERSIGIYMITKTKRGKSFPITVPKKLMEEYYALAQKLDILNEWGIPSIEFPVFDFGIETFNPKLRKENPLLWRERYIKHAYDFVRYNLIQKTFEKVLNKKIKIHSLRHSRATDLLESDVPLEEIQKLLGHSRIDTTLIYSQVTLGKIKKSMEKIDTI